MSVPLALYICLPLLVSAQTAILQLQVVEGEGAVHAAGSKSQRPVILQVTDETGRPVEGAAVSFLLPEEVGAQFPNGIKTEIVVTGPDGRASVRGIQWGSPGTVRMRVTAAKDRARAGTIVTQFITDALPPGGPAATSSYWTAASGASTAKPRSKWVLIGLLAGAAAGVGLATTLAKRPASSPALAAPVAVIPTVRLGAPSITIGKP